MHSSKLALTAFIFLFINTAAHARGDRLIVYHTEETTAALWPQSPTTFNVTISVPGIPGNFFWATFEKNAAGDVYQGKAIIDQFGPNERQLPAKAVAISADRKWLLISIYEDVKQTKLFKEVVAQSPDHAL